MISCRPLKLATTESLVMLFCQHLKICLLGVKMWYSLLIKMYCIQIWTVEIADYVSAHISVLILCLNFLGTLVIKWHISWLYMHLYHISINEIFWWNCCFALNGRWVSKIFQVTCCSLGNPVPVTPDLVLKKTCCHCLRGYHALSSPNRPPIHNCQEVHVYKDQKRHLYILTGKIFRPSLCVVQHLDNFFHLTKLYI